MAKIGLLTAEALSEHCLTYLAEHPGELAEFMVATGTTPDGLRRAVASGDIMHGLIDYVAQNESLLLAICTSAGIAPESFMRVCAKLNPAG